MYDGVSLYRTERPEPRRMNKREPNEVCEIEINQILWSVMH